MKSEETRALIDDFYKTLSRGDRAHLLELLAEDIEWQMPASIPDGVWRGREKVANELGADTVRRLFQRGTFRLNVYAVYVDGNIAIVQTGTEAITKAGNVYKMEYAWVYTCKDNRIAHIREYLDTRSAAQMLGWD